MREGTFRRFDDGARRTRRETPRTAPAGRPEARGSVGARRGGLGRAGGGGPCNATSDGGLGQQQQQQEEEQQE